MALFGSFATIRAQAPQTAGFATAFAYVEEVLRGDSPAARRLREIAPGKSQKVELAGGVFVVEQAYETKARPEGFFESHRRYIDVQVIVEGEELMEVADAAHMTVRDPFNPERDLVTYQDFNDASQLRARAGDTAVFFPVDVHMPSLRLREAGARVRKAVVKIPIGSEGQ